MIKSSEIKMSMNEARWKLKDFIEIDYLNWFELSKNPHPAAIELLMKNKELVDWRRFCINPSDEAIEYLKKNPDKIYFDYLCINSNPAIMELLKGNESKINWSALSANSGAIELLKANQNKINCSNLAANPAIFELKDGQMELLEWIPKIARKSRLLSSNPNAVDYLIKNDPENIDYYYFSSNPNAVAHLKANPNKINFGGLAINPNSEAIKLFKECYKKGLFSNFTLNHLCKNNNPDALDLLIEYNYDEFFKNYEYLYSLISSNPSIFELDYYQMKNNERYREFEEELIKEVMKPSRVFKYYEYGYDIIEELFDY
jgi:hypothetical protein